MTLRRHHVAWILFGFVLPGLVGCSSATSGETRVVGSVGSPAGVVSPVLPARRAASVLPREVPARIMLPSGVEVAIRPATTTPDGLLGVPDDTRVAGWWQGSSRVGDAFGSTLVAAHVDSVTQGLGPFAELLSIRPGARVVLDTEHLTQEFAVKSLRLIPRGPLADQRWLFAATGSHRLTLVTCAPPYDRSGGGYQHLAVVTAIPVNAPRRGRSR